MISQNDVDAALPVAINLANRDRAVLPIGDTPIATLVDACYIPQLHLSKVNDDFDFLKAALNQSQAKNASGKVVHDELMEEATDLAASAISGIITVAKTAANPVINDCLEAMQNAMDQLSVGEPPFNITMQYLPPIYENSALVSMIERYRETAAVTRQPLTWLPSDPGDEVLIKAAKTGVARLDADVNALTSDEDRGLLLAAWRKLRNGDDDINFPPALLDVIGFLMCRRLSTDLTFLGEDLGVDLRTAMTHVAQVMEQKGRSIWITIQRDERDFNSGTFVRSMPVLDSKNTDIKVSGRGYKKWIDSGGTPEVLMGAAVAGLSSYPTGDMLTANTKEYTRLYNQRQKAKTMEDMANQHVNAKNALMRCMTAYINEEDALENKAEFHHRLKEWINRCALTSNTDYTDYCRRLVCEVLYPSNPLIYRMLDAMAGYCKRDVDLPVREAATLAVVDILTEWVAKQLIIEDVK